MEVQILDWPDTFFVQAGSPDHWMRKFGSPEGPAPHLVDISIPECDCESFKRMYQNGKKGQCNHITAARAFRNQFSAKPQQLPPLKHE
jgi:hypothetical protein